MPVIKENKFISRILFRAQSLVYSCCLFLILAFVQSCIEEYTPSIKEEAELLVVEGSVIKGDSLQKVVISKSTSIYQSGYNPVSGCQVWVEDSDGNKFQFSETPSGYFAHIPEEYLFINNSFKIHIILDGENEYESDFEPILASSAVDSVYFLYESLQNSTEYVREGIHFYTDLLAQDNGESNYRWLVEETYEYRNKYTIDGYWHGPPLSYLEEYSPVNDSFKVCWQTNKIKEFYTATTKNISANEKKMISLHYLPAGDKKIAVRYSILVKQYALSDDAFVYWNNLQFENQGGDGLYQKQPSQLRGNIYNVNDKDEVVLGYFWASSYTEKRIFIEYPFPDIIYKETCEIDTLAGFDDLDKDTYVSVLFYSPRGEAVWGVVSDYCLDCRMNGGTINKPDFWDEE